MVFRYGISELNRNCDTEIRHYMLNHVLNPEHHVPSYYVHGHKQQQLLVVHAQPLDAENMVS